MYRFYSDIKEEEQENEDMINYFKLDIDSCFTGPKTIETLTHITRAIFKDGSPIGLVVIKNKINNRTLHAFFSKDGKPNGTWILYDKRFNIIKKRFFNY